MITLHYRFFWPFVLITACLVSLCVIVAVSLFRQQETVTGLLRENATSRKAASDLRGCLNMLIALETHRRRPRASKCPTRRSPSPPIPTNSSRCS